MDTISQYFSTHSLAIMAAVLAVLLIIYFLFTQLVKMVLVIILLLAALSGYFYFKYPGHVWENMKLTLQKAWTQTGKVVDTGKDAYKEGKKLYKEGKEIPGQLKKALDKDQETTE